LFEGAHASSCEPVYTNIVVAGVGRDGATIVNRLQGAAPAVRKLFLTASPTQTLSQSPDLIRVRSDGGGRDELRAALAGAQMVVATAAVAGREAALVPEVVELARREGALAVAILVEPLLTGAPQRSDAADRLTADVMRAADATIIVPADPHAVAALNISEAFDGWNKRLYASLHGLLGTAAAEDAMNLHMDDIAATLSKHCRATIGVGTGQTVEEALRDATANTLAPAEQLETTRAVLAHVIGGGTMPLDEARRTVFVLERLFPKADVRCGVSVRGDDAGIRATVIAGKLDAGPARSRSKRRTQPAESPFFNVGDPTVYDGEHLDIPAFLRKGVALPGAPPKPVPAQTTLFDRSGAEAE